MDISDVNILAKYQADLFEKSIDYFDCSSLYFVMRFMHSKLAKRMDNINFLNESRDVFAALEELSKEKNMYTGRDKIPPYIMSWIGYLYRYWVLTYNITSRWLYTKVKPALLLNLYEAYHSLDIDECINRLNESLNLKYGIDRLFKD